MAARAGALIADAEFVQFHPTAIDIGADPAPLATEALRGEGATDRRSQRTDAFCRRRSHGAELAPRDIVARGVFAASRAGDGAFLDARAAVGAAFPERFPNVFARCMAAGVDPVTAPIPIAPAAHYHMGGVWTDAGAAASLPGLWAAGEVASTGLHGANRLASNSLLEAVVFGARVAARRRASAAPAPDAVERSPREAVHHDARIALSSRNCADVMASHVGVMRDGAGLARALGAIMRLRGKAARRRERETMLTTALLHRRAAYSRRESRGAHFRSDFPTPYPAQAARRSLASR